MPAYDATSGLSSASGSGFQNWRTLGFLWILYGAFRIAVALFLFLYTNVATAMFGSLIEHVAHPFAMMNMFHIWYAALIFFLAGVGVLDIIAGIALAGGQQSGRVVALFAAFFSLCELPLGLTLGVYTLIALLPLRAAPIRATTQEYTSRAA